MEAILEHSTISLFVVAQYSMLKSENLKLSRLNSRPSYIEGLVYFDSSKAELKTDQSPLRGLD